MVAENAALYAAMARHVIWRDVWGRAHGILCAFLEALRYLNYSINSRPSVPAIQAARNYSINT